MSFALTLKVSTLNIFVSILAYYSFDGQTVRGLKICLNNRVQRREVNRSYFICRAIRSGIPKESVLGCVLFIIFINDMEEAVDSLLLSSQLIPNWEEELIISKERLPSRAAWMKSMKLSKDKCKVLHLEIITYSNTGWRLIYWRAGLLKRIQWCQYTDSKLNESHCALAEKRIAWDILTGAQSAFLKKLLSPEFVMPYLEYSVQFWATLLQGRHQLTGERCTEMIMEQMPCVGKLR